MWVNEETCSVQRESEWIDLIDVIFALNTVCLTDNCVLIKILNRNVLVHKDEIKKSIIVTIFHDTQIYVSAIRNDKTFYR